MELKIRKLIDSDWDLLVKWWKMHPEWKHHPSKEMLPENGTGGYIIEKGEIPIVAGFLYTTNSKVGWIEWIISNRKYKSKDKKDAVQLLITGMEHVARTSGCEVILSIGRNKSLIKSHEELGYIVDPDPSYELSKNIKVWQQ
tara:strand:+ start:44 stop:469 length:426 start_codon:yes stop_codon:yes gene_type:complete